MLIEKTIAILKDLYFGDRGEPYYLNKKKYYFQIGSRPIRDKYINSKSDVVRNDILQFDFVLRELKSNSIFYDIGAHFGTYSMLASSILQGDNSIYAFEPDTASLKILHKNINYNNLNNRIKIKEIAISSTVGNLSFNMQNGNSMSHLVTNLEPKYKGKLTSVKTDTLNNLILSLPIPTLLKIDTEGAEFDIIKGATKLLEIPSIIFVCELHPFAWGWYKDNSWDEFLALLKSYDRKILVLDPKKTFSDLPYYGTIIF